jgi:hypothetical protein
MQAQSCKPRNCLLNILINFSYHLNLIKPIEAVQAKLITIIPQKTILNPNRSINDAHIALDNAFAIE